MSNACSGDDTKKAVRNGMGWSLGRLVGPGRCRGAQSLRLAQGDDANRSHTGGPRTLPARKLALASFPL